MSGSGLSLPLSAFYNDNKQPVSCEIRLVFDTYYEPFRNCISWLHFCHCIVIMHIVCLCLYTPLILTTCTDSLNIEREVQSWRMHIESKAHWLYTTVSNTCTGLHVQQWQVYTVLVVFYSDTLYLIYCTWRTQSSTAINICFIIIHDAIDAWIYVRMHVHINNNCQLSVK